jgi:hypothetical protein
VRRARLALRMRVGRHNVCGDTSARRTSHIARATAVQVQWLGHVPVFAACGAQVVMRMCVLLSVCLGEGRTGSGRVRWGCSASICRSSVRVVSLQIDTLCMGGGGEGTSPSGVGGVHAGGAEIGAAVWSVECGGGVGPRGGGAHKALPVRSLPEVFCLLTGAGLWARARRRIPAGL